MSSGAQQLKEDFTQIQKLLEIYPDIKIINTEGDPPEQYDIEYTIKGYITNPEGAPTPDNNHEIRITLPFGYPHFPPTVKPISPIFHPDIDPDAIRIADFWQENHSLSELIVHIGQMICGNHYTKDEPFNQDAFEWFEERSSWLPFDILEPRDEDDIEEVETDVSSSDTEKQQSFAPATDLDILKDDINFPFDDDDFDGLGDEVSFDIGEDTVADDLTGMEEAESTDEVTFDQEGEEPAETPDIQENETEVPPSDTEEQQSFAPAAELDILKDDFDFPFDDDDFDGPGDEVSFDIEENTGADDLTGQEETESTDEVTFDLEEKESAESLDIQNNKDTGTEDLFSLETEDFEDDISFEPTGEPDSTESTDESSLPDGLFDLETDDSDEESTLEFDSEDIASAFGEETEADDTTLDGLADLEEEDDTFDFDIDDESMDSGGGITADLSGLEEDTPEKKSEEVEFDTDENSEDEEKILSALSLNEEFSSSDKLEGKSQAILSLIEQKQIFSAKKVLTELPDSDSLPEKKEFEQTIADAVSEAEDLYKKADSHEQKGEFEKAGILLDLVANIAIDFPGLDFSRNRIRESMMAGTKKKPDAEHDDNAEQTDDEEADASAKTPVKKKKGRANLSFKIPARLIIILVVVIIIGGIGAGTSYVYNNDSESIQLAQTSFQKAEQLVDSKEFKNAQKELNTSRTTLDKILFFQSTKKEAILLKITGLANSSLFKEGLKGRVLYGDQYYSIETAKAIDKFNTQKSYAEQVLKSKKIEQAILAYEKSLPYAQKAGFKEQVKEISQKIAELRLEVQLNQARQYEKEQNWLDAEKAYQNALELSKSISTTEIQNNIAIQRATSSYRHYLQEGLTATNDSEWQKSVSAFQEVQKVVQESPQIIPEADKTEIDKLLIQSQLFYKLTLAKQAYENKEWKQAIDTYNDAIILMETSTSLLGQEAAGNIEKINKTILTTHVAREQAKIGATTAANELDETVKHYETIVTLIEKSTFKDDEILSKILEDARTKTAEIKKQQLISKREKWLMDNYEEIFRDNYPSAKQSELLNPQVRFIKREENIMIFNLSCSERKQGRTFRLELNYQHDMDKDAWSIFSGTIEEE